MIMNVKARGESPDLPAGATATRSAISARAYSGLTSVQPQRPVLDRTLPNRQVFSGI